MIESLRKILDDPSCFISEENCWGFCDWFCKTESLEHRARGLLAKARKIANSTKINLDSSYLWFNNNCPVDGHLYDEFNISDIKTDEVLYTIVPKTGHKVKDGLFAEVFCFKGEPRESQLRLPTYRDVVAWFMEENKVIAIIPDEDIPLHIKNSSLSIEGQRLLIERLKKVVE